MSLFAHTDQPPTPAEAVASESLEDVRKALGALKRIAKRHGASPLLAQRIREATAAVEVVGGLVLDIYREA